MKSRHLPIILSLPMFLFPVFLSACSSSQAVRDSAPGAAFDDSPLQARQATLIVFGMSCPLCANNVDKALLAVPGVKSVDVDMSTGKAHVSLDSSTPVTRRQLANAIHKSGFSLQRIETP